MLVLNTVKNKKTNQERDKIDEEEFEDCDFPNLQKSRRYIKNMEKI